jgi:hypothetical protein
VEVRLHVVLTADLPGGGDQCQDRSMLLIEQTGHCVTVGDFPNCTVSDMPLTGQNVSRAPCDCSHS